jgi:hypothetical protein
MHDHLKPPKELAQVRREEKKWGGKGGHKHTYGTSRFLSLKE